MHIITVKCNMFPLREGRGDKPVMKRQNTNMNLLQSNHENIPWIEEYDCPSFVPEFPFNLVKVSKTLKYAVGFDNP